MNDGKTAHPIGEILATRLRLCLLLTQLPSTRRNERGVIAMAEIRAGYRRCCVKSSS